MAMKNTPAASSAGPPISSPQTPFSSTPGAKCVSLFDWWLVKVESEAGGKRLAVSGLTTRGQHATRIFCSAPIVRRYNAYTLESEDGITVRIQGIINKARMHHNGFPPEVCNCFLTGFPYNWDGYVDESFAQKPYTQNTSGSKSHSLEPEKHSAGISGSAFPLHIEEFPLGRVLDVLNLGSDTDFSDLLTSNSSDIQRDSSGHKLTPPITTVRSDMTNSDPSVLPVHTSIASPSKCGIRKCSQTHADDNITGPSVEYDIQHNASVEVEVEDCVNTYSSNGVCGEVNGNTMLAKLNVDALHMPSFSEKAGGDALPEGSGMQMERPLENKECSRLWNHKNSPAWRASGTQKAGSPTKLGVLIETSLNPTVAKSPEKANVSNEKQKGGGQTEQKRVSLDSKKTSSVVVSDNNMRTNHTDRESRNSSTVVNIRRPNPSPSCEIEEGCLRILEKIKSCSLSPEKTCIEQGGTIADMKSTETSEVELCLDRSLNKVNALKETSSGHMNPDTASVIRKLNFSNCKEPRDRSSKRKREYAEENLTNYEPRILRSMTKKLCHEGQDNKMKRHIVKEDDRQNTVRPSPAEQEFAVGTDLKLAHRKHARKMAKGSGKEGDIRKTDTEQDIKEDCYSFHPCPSAHEILHGDGHANNQVGMGITEKCKDSENAVEGHCANENTVAKFTRRHKRKGDQQYASKSEASLKMQSAKNKESYIAKREAIWRPSFPQAQSTLMLTKAERASLIDPEVLNLRRSRSGRLLVPTLPNWCQHLVYDVDGTITGIAGVNSSSSTHPGTKSEPLRKKKKLN